MQMHPGVNYIMPQILQRNKLAIINYLQEQDDRLVMLSSISMHINYIQ